MNREKARDYYFSVEFASWDAQRLSIPRHRDYRSLGGQIISERSSGSYDDYFLGKKEKEYYSWTLASFQGLSCLSSSKILTVMVENVIASGLKDWELSEQEFCKMFPYSKENYTSARLRRAMEGVA